MKDGFNLGIQHRIFNNEVRKRRLEMGLTQDQLNELCDLRWQTIGKIENFRCYPSIKKAKKIAEVLGTIPEVLFPNWLEVFKPQRTTTVTEHIITEPLLENQANPLLLTDGSELEDNIDHQLLTDEINKQLSTLSDREQRVVKEYYGFNGNSPKTLEETARIFGVTRERIR